METRNTPEKITVQGIIELTKGAYGADKFERFFNTSPALSSTEK
jgi:hypothetical protein